MTDMTTVFALPKVPSRLVVTPGLSDEEFEQLCITNADVPLERTKEGEIVVNAPAGFGTSDANSEIIAQLRVWWKTHRLGRVTDSSAGFFLPDGSVLSPDAAYVTAEQVSGLTAQSLDHFLHFAPAFVIELRSKSDSLSSSQKKMAAWIDNGAQLGWLIDPQSRTVSIYEAGKETRVESGSMVSGSGPVAGFVLDLAEVWSSYEV